MKKFTKTICVLFLTIVLTRTNYAQVFPESFEGAVFPPTGWVVFDNGIGTVQSWSQSITAPQSGTASAYIQYENVTSGIAEDWLVTPSVVISPTANILSFWERETYTTNWGSVYNILISTSSQTNVATFTTVVSYPENLSSPLVYKNRAVNLSAYNGQTVYIAFRMDNDDGDDWFIDNIQLSGGCSTPPFAGSITGTTSTNIGSTNSYSVAPITGDIQWIYASSPTGPWTAITGATTTPANITAAVGGSMYLAVVASSTVGGCISDTTNNPHLILVNFPGDNVCNAMPLPIGPSATYYQFFGASVQPGEVAPPAGNCTSQQTWCINTLENTRWFTFVAPASGHVTIQSPDFDTQLAVWKVNNCNDLLSASNATFVCANDDDPNYTANGGVQFSSFLHAACLTPGATYYVQADSYSAASTADSSRIIISAVNSPLDPSFTGLNSAYCMPSATSTSFVPVSLGGIFTLNTSTASINAFNPTTAGIGTHTVTHTVSGCISKSVTTVANTPTVNAVSNNSLICVGQTSTLSATGATTYSWSTGGTGMAITVNPTVTTSYTVTGTTGGCSASTIVTQNVSTCSSIGEQVNQNLISIYPNPNSGIFTISSKEKADGIIITDLLGHQILNVVPQNNTTVIDIKAFSQGIYFVTLKINSVTSTTKIIKD